MQEKWLRIGRIGYKNVIMRTDPVPKNFSVTVIYSGEIIVYNDIPYHNDSLVLGNGGNKISETSKVGDIGSCSVKLDNVITSRTP